MKTVTKVQTFDGALHDTEAAARRHAEKLYGEALSRLAARLVAIQKYSPMMEFIDSNLSEFEKLKTLKSDTWLEVEP